MTCMGPVADVPGGGGGHNCVKARNKEAKFLLYLCAKWVLIGEGGMGRRLCPPPPKKKKKKKKIRQWAHASLHDLFVVYFVYYVFFLKILWGGGGALFVHLI